MAEETVDKIVIELDYDLAEGAQEKISDYEKMAEDVQKKAAKMRDRFKEGFSNLFGSKSFTETPLMKNLRALNIPIDEKIDRFVKAKGAKNLKPDDLDWIKSQRDERDNSGKNINELFQKTEKNERAETFAKQKEEKKRVFAEKKRIKDTLAAERKGQTARNNIWAKSLRSFSIATSGYLGVRLARNLYSGLQNTAAEATSLKTTAMMANTNPQEVQAVQKWFKENNVNPERGMQTLQSYARFMGMSNVPLDKILPRMIQAAKSGSAQAAVAHGADPDAIRAFREYTGNAAKDLANFKLNPLFSDEEIKRYEKAQKVFSHISDSFERLKVGAFTTILETLEEWGKEWNKFWKDFQGSELKKDFDSATKYINDKWTKLNEAKPLKQSFGNLGALYNDIKDAYRGTPGTHSDVISEPLRDYATPETLKEREEYLKRFQSNSEREEYQSLDGQSTKVLNNDRQIQVINNFTITSNSPEDVATEVQKSIDREFFEKEFSKYKIKPATVF